MVCNRYLIYIFCLLFLSGCGAALKKNTDTAENKMTNLAETVQSLEQRVNNISHYCSLIVADGNKLHNEMEGMNLSNSYLHERLEALTNSVYNLEKFISALEAHYITMEEALNNQICNIQKAEIELSNRLEMLRLETKDTIKEETVSSASH